LAKLQTHLHMGDIGTLPFKHIIAESALDPNRLSFLNELGCCIWRLQKVRVGRWIMFFL